MGSIPTRFRLFLQRNGRPVDRALFEERIVNFVVKATTCGGNPGKMSSGANAGAMHGRTPTASGNRPPPRRCRRSACASGRMPPCSEVIPPRPTVGQATRPHGAAAYPTTAAPGFPDRLHAFFLFSAPYRRFPPASAGVLPFFDTSIFAAKPCLCRIPHFRPGCAGERTFRS